MVDYIFKETKMTKQNYTDITFVLDRSGSMSVIREETITGFNVFLSEQQKVPGKATMTLAQFDHEYEMVYEARQLKDTPALNGDTYVPRGYTALLDAIGRTINSTGNRLAGMQEDQRPDKVIFVILTDGLENYSKEFNSSRINEMIKSQRANYQWEFVFLGANQDAIDVAGNIGIEAAAAMTFTANTVGTGYLYGAISRNIASYRTGQSTGVSFSDEDRQKQTDAAT